MRYLILVICLLFPITGEASCLGKIIKDLLSDTPNHVLYRNEEKRMEFVEEVKAVAKMFDIDPILIIYTAYKESGFDKRAKGDYKKDGIPRSHGMLQFGYVVRKECRKQLNLNLKRRFDQLICFGYWVNRLRQNNECGSLKKALTAYGSKGGTCRGTPKGRRIAKHRIQMTKELRCKHCQKNQ